MRVIPYNYPELGKKTKKIFCCIILKYIRIWNEIKDEIYGTKGSFEELTIS